MEAVKNETRYNELYTLKLSFIEMHIIMQAMDNYAYKTGYGQWNTSAPNLMHAEAAEKFHDQLSDFYCNS